MSGPRSLPERIGRFQIRELLATGGMAEIFLAWETSAAGLERHVVIKRILPHLAAKESYRRAFVQEARYVGRLNHPNVVQIYELGEQDGELYLVMEYVRGTSLWVSLQRTVMSGLLFPADVIASVGLQTAAGLHAAHELRDAAGLPLGLVHRDVTPHNLMITAEGHLKLLDFGIAKGTDSTLEATRSGILKGKLSYMSPEQARQKPLDRRSDVFALGIVLWEMATGRRLFRREADLDTMQAIVSERVPDPRELRPDFPAPLAQVILHALERDLDLRAPTAEAIRLELESACAELELRPSTDAVARFAAELADESALETQRLGLDDIMRGTYDDGETSIGGSEQAAPLTPTRAVETGEVLDAVPLTPSSGPETGRSPRLGRSRGWAVALFGVMMLGALAAGYTLERKLSRPTGPPIRLALAPIMDPETLLEGIEPLRAYLEDKLQRPVEMEVAKSYGDVAQRLLDGAVDYASLPPYTYLETKAKDARVQVVALKLIDGSWGSDGVLLVQEQSGIESIPQLTGKRWCIPDERSTTGFVLPRAALRRAGIDPDRELEKVVTGNHLESLRALNAGRCDVAGTYSGAFLSAQDADIPVGRLRTLTITGRAPADAIVARPGADPGERARVQAALLSFDPMEILGEETLDPVERISGFGAGSDAQYDKLREALGSGAHRPRAQPVTKTRQSVGSK